MFLSIFFSFTYDIRNIETSQSDARKIWYFGFTSNHGENFELRYSSLTLSHSRHFSRRDIVQMSVYIQRIYHKHDARGSAEHSRRRVLIRATQMFKKRTSISIFSDVF